MFEKGEDFTFETVLSTDRNLKLLKKAKDSLSSGKMLRLVEFDEKEFTLPV